MQRSKTIRIPDKVNQILQSIEQAGFPAYVVGGCVRDSIMGREPKDWDITTKAMPEDVKKLFRRTVDTGIEHGTVTVMIGKDGYEVTTYRVDGEYEDSRHPKEVTFTEDLREDLRRRDFTINAMAYNESEGLVDVFDGISDIHNKVIRAVGDPKERFGEDALRMMRALRFSAELGYKIEDETRYAIVIMAADLQKISAERIQTELVKLLISPHPDKIEDAYALGVTKYILPEFDEVMKDGSRGENVLVAMHHVPRDKVARMATLFSEFGEISTEAICRRLKFDNVTRKLVAKIVSNITFQPDQTEAAVRKAIYEIGTDAYPYIYPIQKAIIQSGSETDDEKEQRLKDLEAVHQIYQQILARGDCLSLKELQITGKDLLNLGMRSGKSIGYVLESLLEEVLKDPKKNDFETLKSIAIKNIEKLGE